MCTALAAVFVTKADFAAAAVSQALAPTKTGGLTLKSANFCLKT
jgi:hypothetical protein